MEWKIIAWVGGFLISIVLGLIGIIYNNFSTKVKEMDKDKASVKDLERVENAKADTAVVEERHININEKIDVLFDKVDAQTDVLGEINTSMALIHLKLENN
ncbi:MAG: hypothetical protein KAJ19_00455 [Gammaproteobacteria bacterium]|nr:hypothetical protein [Gammaproteobacteria bacterium]